MFSNLTLRFSGSGSRDDTARLGFSGKEWSQNLSTNLLSQPSTYELYLFTSLFLHQITNVITFDPYLSLSIVVDDDDDDDDDYNDGVESLFRDEDSTR